MHATPGLILLMIFGGAIVGVVATYLVIRLAIMGAIGRGLGW